MSVIRLVLQRIFRSRRQPLRGGHGLLAEAATSSRGWRWGARATSHALTWLDYDLSSRAARFRSTARRYPGRRRLIAVLLEPIKPSSAWGES